MSKMANRHWGHGSVSSGSDSGSEDPPRPRQHLALASRQGQSRVLAHHFFEGGCLFFQNLSLISIQAVLTQILPLLQIFLLGF